MDPNYIIYTTSPPPPITKLKRIPREKRTEEEKRHANKLAQRRHRANFKNKTTKAKTLKERLGRNSNDEEFKTLVSQHKRELKKRANQRYYRKKKEDILEAQRDVIRKKIDFQVRNSDIFNTKRTCLRSVIMRPSIETLKDALDEIGKKKPYKKRRANYSHKTAERKRITAFRKSCRIAFERITEARIKSKDYRKLFLKNARMTRRERKAMDIIEECKAGKEQPKMNPSKYAHHLGFCSLEPAFQISRHLL